MSMENDEKNELALLREFFDADNAMLKLRNVPRVQRDHEHLVAVSKAGRRRAEARKAVMARREEPNGVS